MTFQYEVFDYHPMNGEAEMKLFNYQPDILVQTTQVVMPGLAEMQRDANWEEGTVSWSDLANLAIPSWNVMDTVEVDCAA